MNTRKTQPLTKNESSLDNIRRIQRQESEINKFDTTYAIDKTLDRILNEDISKEFFEDINQAKKNIYEQYGENIRTNRYKSSTLIWMILIFLAFTIISIEIFVQSNLSELEMPIILRLQAHFQEFIKDDVRWPIYLLRSLITFTDYHNIRYFVFALYLSTDPILATKCGLVSFMGMFVMTVLKMLYQEARPYWEYEQVKCFQCAYDFEGPCDHLFNIVFFFSYLNLIYFEKYARSSYRKSSYCVIIAQIILIPLMIYAGLILGVFYIYQAVIGIVYSIFYLAICLHFDNDIHMYCENVAFIQKKARKNKFSLLFNIISVMAATIITLNYSLYKEDKPPMDWYINNKLKCIGMREHFNGHNIGLKATFYDTYILACVPTMVFGVSFIMSIDSTHIKWAKTSWPFTLARLFIGIGIAIGLDVLFTSYLTLWNNHASIYVFSHLFPGMTSTFFIFAVMPIISQRLGLSRTGLRQQVGSVSSLSSSTTNLEQELKEKEESLKEPLLQSEDQKDI